MTKELNFISDAIQILIIYFLFQHTNSITYYPQGITQT